MKFNKIQIDHKKFTKLNFKEISTIKIELKEREIKENEYSCNINNKTNISSEFNINEYSCNTNECDERENNKIMIHIDENQNFTFEEKNHSTEKPNKILEINRLKPTWREVYKVKFESKEPFVPGDSIGILCPNKDEFPQKILKLLNLENDHYKIERIGLNPFKFTGKLYDFFKYVFDFTSLPKKAFINKISNGNQYLDFLCSKEGSSDYFKMIKNWNNVIDLIVMFDLKLKLEDLLVACETLKPRYFSLINKIGDNHEILVGITSKKIQVENKNGDKEDILRHGHVSEFIKNPNGNIKIIMRPSKLIRLNKDPKHLLICTGTGIAPFLSFLKNKNEDQMSWVIYGFRNDNDDLFDNDNFYENTKIDKIKSSEGEYVTDFILKKLEKIIEFTKEDCSVYVCGRMDMQKNVYKIFLTYFKKLIEDKKIFFDNWQ